MDPKTLADTLEINSLINGQGSGGKLEIVLDKGRVYSVWQALFTPNTPTKQIRIIGNGAIIEKPIGSPFQCFKRQSGRTAYRVNQDGSTSNYTVPCRSQDLPDLTIEDLTFNGPFAPPSTIADINKKLLANAGLKWNCISTDVWDGTSDNPAGPTVENRIPPMTVRGCKFYKSNTGVFFDAPEKGLAEWNYFEDMTGHAIAAQATTDRVNWVNGRRIEIEALNNKTLRCKSDFDFSNVGLLSSGEEKPPWPDFVTVRNWVSQDCKHGGKCHGGNWFIDLDGYQFERPYYLHDNAQAFAGRTQTGWGGNIRNLYAKNVWSVLNLRGRDAVWNLANITGNGTFQLGINQSRVIGHNLCEFGTYHSWQSWQDAIHHGAAYHNTNQDYWRNLLDTKQAEVDAEKLNHPSVQSGHRFDNVWLPFPRAVI